MTTTTGISFLGQSQAQSGRLRELQTLMSDLQRQATTQKKYETMSGFGFDSLRLQRYRMDANSLDTYMSNIGTATTRIDIMNNAMTKASDLGRQLISAISTDVLGGEVDIESIRTIARNNLSFLQSLVNTEVDGRYLFAGSATDTVPVENTLQPNSYYQGQVQDWLNGTITTAQLQANAAGTTPVQLGYDPALSASGNVSIRIDDSTEVDYTVMGNANGFDQIMNALAFAANFELPDAATDVPSVEEFTKVLQGIMNMAQEGVKAMDSAVGQISGKYSLVQTIESTHETDRNLYLKLIDQQENVDTTEVLVQLQSLKTQLEASFQVTNIVSQLSLVNYLPR